MVYIPPKTPFKVTGDLIIVSWGKVPDNYKYQDENQLFNSNIYLPGFHSKRRYYTYLNGSNDRMWYHCKIGIGHNGDLEFSVQMEGDSEVFAGLTCGTGWSAVLKERSSFFENKKTSLSGPQMFGVRFETVREVLQKMVLHEGARVDYEVEDSLSIQRKGKGRRKRKRGEIQNGLSNQEYPLKPKCFFRKHKKRKARSSEVEKLIKLYTRINFCLACKEPIIEGSSDETIRCTICSHRYHTKCIMDYSKSKFICPRHYCSLCGIQDSMSVTCCSCIRSFCQIHTTSDMHTQLMKGDGIYGCQFCQIEMMDDSISTIQDVNGATEVTS